MANTKLKFIAMVVIVVGVAGLVTWFGVMVLNDHSSASTPTPVSQRTINYNNVATVHPIQTATPTPMPTPTPQEYMASCKAVSYDDLLRHNDDYQFEDVKISGSVTQVMGDTGDFTLLVDMSDPDSYMAQNAWVDWYGADRYLEDDQVTIYGYVRGLKKYETVLGAEKTVPEIRAEYIVLKK